MSSPKRKTYINRTGIISPFQKYLQTNGLPSLPINDFFKKLILNPKKILIFGRNLKFWGTNWPLNQKWWLEICRLLSFHLFRAKNFQNWVIWTKVMTRNYCWCKCRHFTETMNKNMVFATYALPVVFGHNFGSNHSILKIFGPK